MKKESALVDRLRECKHYKELHSEAVLEIELLQIKVADLERNCQELSEAYRKATGMADTYDPQA